MNDKYTINADTLAIIPISKKKTRVYENDTVLTINRNANKIIADNCEYFGSSYVTIQEDD